MTSYLLIDLDKSAVGCVAPTGETSQVFLFAKKKNNRQLAKDFAMENPKVAFVKVGKDETLAEVLTAKLKKLLKKQPNAKFLIDSPRGKVAKSVSKLLNRFPDANVMLLDVVPADNDDADNDDTQYIMKSEEAETATAGNKADNKTTTNKMPKNLAPIELTLPTQPATSNKPIKNKKVPVPKKPSLLPKAEPKSLKDISFFQQQVLLDKVSQNHKDKSNKEETDAAVFAHLLSRFDEVIGVLTKGYPKKKDVLLQEIAQSLNLKQEEAESVVENLLSNGMMTVDNANNVKITNLIHLLKLK